MPRRATTLYRGTLEEQLALARDRERQDAVQALWRAVAAEREALVELALEGSKLGR